MKLHSLRNLFNRLPSILSACCVSIISHPLLLILAMSVALSGCQFIGSQNDETRTTKTAPLKAEKPVVNDVNRDFTYADRFLLQSGCNIEAPVQVVSLDGRLQLENEAMIGSALYQELLRWQRRTLDPLSQKYLGEPIVSARVAASYACRRVRNGSGSQKMSQHSYGRAIDFSSFTTASGKTFSLTNDYYSDSAAGKFLRALNKKSCEHFSTVIGPEGDAYHKDHFHFDIKPRSGRYRYCH